MSDSHFQNEADQSLFPFMGEVSVQGPRLRVGIVGATGAVGAMLLRVMRERAFPCGELRVFASANSRGKCLDTAYGALMVEQLSKRRVPELDVVFLAAGKDIARTWGWRFAHKGAVVIDKSPYFRDKDYAPLVIPEVNSDDLEQARGIVANPNCTTVPLVMTLAPLHTRYGLKHVTAVTLQSVSGAGKRGLMALQEELQDDDAAPSTFTHRIAYNVIPWIGGKSSTRSGEEVKMVEETRRIMGLPRLSMQVTCVRVPTLIGHAIAIHAEFRRRIPVDEARSILSNSAGLQVMDNPAAQVFPTPLQATGRDAVLVGRIRRDRGPNSLALFLSADNLRKGAALNAVQIAETMLIRGMIKPSQK